jgi:ribA/ribD-fused uncharacterized protein
VDKISEFSGEYRFLSNFWYAQVEFDGEFYLTVEHAYQAAKTLDPVARKAFQDRNMRPGNAKRAGRVLAMRPDWEQVKLNIMLELLRKKFEHPTLKGMLLATGDRYLEEGNLWHDNYWGVCRCMRCVNQRNSGGFNHESNALGELLMQVREELRSQSETVEGSETF